MFLVASLVVFFWYILHVPTKPTFQHATPAIWKLDELFVLEKWETEPLSHEPVDLKICTVTNSSLWKTMLGRRPFPFGIQPICRGRSVSFRRGGYSNGWARSTWCVVTAMFTRTLLTPPLLRCGCSCCLHACILRKSSTEVQKVLREVVFQTIGGGFTRLWL